MHPCFFAHGQLPRVWSFLAESWLMFGCNSAISQSRRPSLVQACPLHILGLRPVQASLLRLSCCSSVVEHVIGNDEVESSILSNSTISHSEGDVRTPNSIKLRHNSGQKIPIEHRWIFSSLQAMAAPEFWRFQNWASRWLTLKPASASSAGSARSAHPPRAGMLRCRRPTRPPQPLGASFPSMSRRPRAVPETRARKSTNQGNNNRHSRHPGWRLPVRSTIAHPVMGNQRTSLRVKHYYASPIFGLRRTRERDAPNSQPT
jgi:hypothetical protein